MWHTLYILVFFVWIMVASWLHAPVIVIVVGFGLMTLAGLFAALDVRSKERDK